MMQNEEKILDYLTSGTNISEVEIDELQELVDKHPYFPVTQYLLLKKLQIEQSSEFATQADKTSLYFPNPYWLHLLLSGGQADGKSVPGNTGELITEAALEEDQITPESINKEYLVSSFPVSEDRIPETGDAPADINDDEDAGQLQKAESEGSMLGEEAETTGSLPVEISDEPANSQKEIQVEELVEAKEDRVYYSDGEAISQQVPELEVVELEEEMAGVSHTIDKTTLNFLEGLSNKPPESRGIAPEHDEHDRMFQNIKAMLDLTSEEAGANVETVEVNIDPYYTIDYFASQGIKLELEQNPQDQLGKNLKKFTQWLKHMKKLGPEDAAESINRGETDADIQMIADSSNTVREIVTEAMASVLEKQGKKEKAIELYNKLSFLNPHKKAYFADKIKNLKGT